MEPVPCSSPRGPRPVPPPRRDSGDRRPLSPARSDVIIPQRGFWERGSLVNHREESGAHEKGTGQPSIQNINREQPSIQDRSSEEPGIQDRGSEEPGNQGRGESGNQERGRGEPGNQGRGRGEPGIQGSDRGEPGIQERGRGEPGIQESGRGEPGNQERGESGNQERGRGEPGNQGRGRGEPGIQGSDRGEPGIQERGRGEPGIQESGRGEPGNQERGRGEPGIQERGPGEPGIQERGPGEPGIQERGRGEPGIQERGRGEPGNQERGRGEPGNQERGRGEPGNQERGRGEPGNQERGRGEPGNQERGRGEPGIQGRGRGEPGIQESGWGEPGIQDRGRGEPGIQESGRGEPGNQERGRGEPGNQERGRGEPGNQERGRGEPGIQGRGRGEPGIQGSGRGEPGNQERGRGEPGIQGRGRGEPGIQGRGRGEPGNQGRGRGEPGNQESGRGEPGIQESGRGEPGIQESGRGEPGIQESGRGEPGIQESGRGEPGNQERGRGEPGNQERGRGEPGNQERGRGEPGNQERGSEEPVNQEGGRGEPGIQDRVTWYATSPEIPERRIRKGVLGAPEPGNPIELIKTPESEQQRGVWEIGRQVTSRVDLERTETLETPKRLNHREEDGPEVLQRRGHKEITPPAIPERSHIEVTGPGPHEQAGHRKSSAPQTPERRKYKTDPGSPDTAALNHAGTPGPAVFKEVPINPEIPERKNSKGGIGPPDRGRHKEVSITQRVVIVMQSRVTVPQEPVMQQQEVPSLSQVEQQEERVTQPQETEAQNQVTQSVGSMMQTPESTVPAPEAPRDIMTQVQQTSIILTQWEQSKVKKSEGAMQAQDARDAGIQSHPTQPLDTVKKVQEDVALSQATYSDLMQSHKPHTGEGVTQRRILSPGEGTTPSFVPGEGLMQDSLIQNNVMVPMETPSGSLGTMPQVTVTESQADKPQPRVPQPKHVAQSSRIPSVDGLTQSNVAQQQKDVIVGQDSMMHSWVAQQQDNATHSIFTLPQDTSRQKDETIVQDSGTHSLVTGKPDDLIPASPCAAASGPSIQLSPLRVPAPSSPHRNLSCKPPLPTPPRSNLYPGPSDPEASPRHETSSLSSYKPKPPAPDTLSYLDSVSLMSGTLESLTLLDDASSLGSDSEINGIPYRRTDKYGFLGGNQYSGNGESSIRVEIARQRELKWLDMFNHWDKWLIRRFQKVKLRCRKGIPSSLRSKAWQLLSNSQELLNKNPGKFEEMERQPGDPKWLDVIEKDLHRQFPFHEMFAARGGHGQQDLYRILKAYTVYRPEEGYCQAQAPVAAVLLMHMPAEQAFWCLVQICDKYLPGYYSAGLEAIQLDGEIFFALLRRVCPMAYRHLKKFKIDPILYMTEWFMCIFSRTLPWASVLRVWDMFFCEGVKIVFRVGLVLLKHTLGSVDKLRSCQGMYETMEKLRSLPPHCMQEEVLLPEISSLSVTDALIERESNTQLRKWRENRGELQYQPSRRVHGARHLQEEKLRLNPTLSSSLLSLTSLRRPSPPVTPTVQPESVVVSEGLRPALPSPTSNKTPLGPPKEGAKKSKEKQKEQGKRKEEEREKRREREEREREKQREREEKEREKQREKEEKKVHREREKAEAKQKKERKFSFRRKEAPSPATEPAPRSARGGTESAGGAVHDTYF